MNDFLGKIIKQLELMTEAEKDAWILSQARILSEGKQESFYKSICGTKRVINMPGKNEIDEFCDKIRNGDIVVEYESYYVEFDSDGYFYDGWKHCYSDPCNAMPFISSVINGCHDLIILEEYEEALEVLDKIIDLKFVVKDHPNTDKSRYEDFIDLNRAACEQLLFLDRGEMLSDYIKACMQTVKNNAEVAEKVAFVLSLPLFAEYPIKLIADCVTKPMIHEVINELAKNLRQIEKECNEKVKGNRYCRDSHDKNRINQITGMIKSFEEILDKESKPEKTFLQGIWIQISDLIKSLSYEQYIDDQLEKEFYHAF